MTKDSTDALFFWITDRCLHPLYFQSDISRLLSNFNIPASTLPESCIFLSFKLAACFWSSFFQLILISPLASRYIQLEDKYRFDLAFVLVCFFIFIFWGSCRSHNLQDLSLWLGLNPGPQQWNCLVLTTGSPANSYFVSLNHYQSHFPASSCS